MDKHVLQTAKLTTVPQRKSSAQIVAGRKMKSHLRRIRNREYRRLRAMVPSVAKQQKVSKVSKYCIHVHMFSRNSPHSPSVENKLILLCYVHDSISAVFERNMGVLRKSKTFFEFKIEKHGYILYLSIFASIETSRIIICGYFGAGIPLN